MTRRRRVFDWLYSLVGVMFFVLASVAGIDAAEQEPVESTGHWAYQPLSLAEPLDVVDKTWVINPIDRFVLSQLEAAGIAPSPQADRYSLIKRLYYDLHGVTPTVEEVDAFLNDSSAGAYEAVVDRLLASTRFAERWARHWLDMARYADTDGYEKDNNRPDAYLYRDWVINSIHSDMPFDQFTIEQLAGDMLDSPSSLQRLATAFNRQTLTNTEGGVDREQWRVAAVMDRTETLGTVWLGLTVGCARCHDHKYDELTQAEYYQLFAYFNNGDETIAKLFKSEQDRHKYEQAKIAHQQEVAKQQAQIEVAKSEVLKVISDREAAILHQLADEQLQVVRWHEVDGISATTSGGTSLSSLEDGSWLATLQKAQQESYAVVFKVPVEQITGLAIEVLPHPSLPKQGPGLAGNGNFVLSELSAYVGDVESGSKMKLVDPTADFSQEKWDISQALDGDTKTGWAIIPETGKAHRAEFLTPGQTPLGETRQLTLVLDQHHDDGGHRIGCFRVLVRTGLSLDQILPQPLREIIILDPDQRSEEQQSRLVEHLVSTSPEVVAEENKLNELTRNTPQPAYMDVRVISHRGEEPRQTHILHRGEFKQPRDEVAPGIPAKLPAIESRNGHQQTDRLDMARWLVDGENPLVPRVVVNHLWDHLFGHGLVRTINDFGVRGQQPTHPKLLDWLAKELIHVDWSRKSLIKTIVMSATYQQASRHRVEMMELDPDNHLLHRQNRFRVEAEIVRDLFLSAAGLLSDQIGGPSVFPPIPPGATDVTYNSNFAWKVSEGEDRYRRGMYTFFKRTAPHPNLMTLDCPDSNVTCVKRERSNTPLAALITLNNAVFHEAAQALARQGLAVDFKTDEDRINFIFRSCVARPTAEHEKETLVRLLVTNREWYQQHADEAGRLIGDNTIADVPVSELAAWVATSRIVLNMDEFITRE